MLPFSPGVFQTVTNELSMEFINNVASGRKMRGNGWRQRDGEVGGGAEGGGEAMEAPMKIRDADR